MPAKFHKSTITVSAVGYKQEGWRKDMERCLAGKGYDLDKTIILDCRYMKGPRIDRGNHIGTATRILRNVIAHDSKMVRGLFDQAAQQLIERPETTDIFCVCEWGKHRSVAVATLLIQALKKFSEQWKISGPVYLAQPHWGLRYCGVKRCCECDNDNDDKQRAYRTASAWWRKIWEDKCGKC